MRLADDLNARLFGTLDEGVLRFDCPCGDGHKIRVKVRRGSHGDGYWQVTEGNSLADLTLSPSIGAPKTGGGECAHFHVKNGGIA